MEFNSDEIEQLPLVKETKNNKTSEKVEFIEQKKDKKEK